MQAALQLTRDALTTAVGALDAGIGSAPGLALAGTWAPLRSQLQALATGEHPAEAPRSVALHSEQVAALSALSELLAQRHQPGTCLVPGAWCLVPNGWSAWLVCVAGALAFGGVLYLAVAFYLAPMADCRRHHHVVGGGDAQKSRPDRAA